MHLMQLFSARDQVTYRKHCRDSARSQNPHSLTLCLQEIYDDLNAVKTANMMLKQQSTQFRRGGNTKVLATIQVDGNATLEDNDSEDEENGQYYALGSSLGAQTQPEEECQEDHNGETLEQDATDEEVHNVCFSNIKKQVRQDTSLPKCDFAVPKGKCKYNHLLRDCPHFQGLKPEQREKHIQTANRCYNC